MKITVHGCGDVGLVTGACFAESGVSVVCLDMDAGAVERLSRGELPVHEPGLEDLVRRNLSAGRLQFTSNMGHAVEHGDAQFIAVSTPPGGNGAADLKQVFAAADSIASHMPGYRLVVCKSTVPVGTCAAVEERISARLAERGVGFGFDVVANPEFLQGGAAVSDFMHPERIILGTDSERAVEYLSNLYAPFHRKRDRLMLMDRTSAELTKYAANAMLATLISFINEIAGLAERAGADIEQVRKGMGADKRIGYNDLYSPEAMRKRGFRYFAVDRGERIAPDNGVGVHPVGEEVVRPWGSFEGLGLGAGYQVKRLKVLPGETLSLQRHRHRDEHWVVVGGAPVAVRDGEDHPLKVGDHILIPVGAVHRIHNPGEQAAEVVEVQLGDYLGEDDIERFEDVYGRS